MYIFVDIVMFLLVEETFYEEFLQVLLYFAIFHRTLPYNKVFYYYFILFSVILCSLLACYEMLTLLRVLLAVFWLVFMIEL